MKFDPMHVLMSSYPYHVNLTLACLPVLSIDLRALTLASMFSYWDYEYLILHAPKGGNSVKYHRLCTVASHHIELGLGLAFLEFLLI